MLSDAAAAAAEDAEGVGFVEDKAVFEALFELNLERWVRTGRSMGGGGREERTTLGRSTMSPVFSKRPSVTMKRLVSDFFAISFLTFSSTRSRSSMSLCSYHLMVLLEISSPFWIEKFTALSATMISPLLLNAGMTLEMVENACAYTMHAGIPRNFAMSRSTSMCTSWVP